MSSEFHNCSYLAVKTTSSRRLACLAATFLFGTLILCHQAEAVQLENNREVVLNPGEKLSETGDREFRPQFGDETVVKFQIGAKIKTRGGSFARVKVILPVPNVWPEQSVTIDDKKMSDRIGEIKYRVLDSGVKQMVVAISKIPPNTEEEVSVTYRIAVRSQQLPKTTDGLIHPIKKSKAIRLALGNSPGINPKYSKIRKILKELYEKDTPAWEKGKKIHQWVTTNTKEAGRKKQDTAKILASKEGRNEDRIALFIAMMRAAKIPCRLVVTANTGYAEFCLETPTGKQIWYPCQLRGSGTYGYLERAMPIFQKGDNIRMPETKKRERVIAEHIAGKGQVQPSVRIYRRIVE